MKDIAEELNLSITTVSFVVNGKSASISPATVQKVQNLIKERGFNPNSAARVLRTGKSKTIGLIIEDVGNYFFGQIAKIIETEAHKSGYKVFLSSTEDDDEKAKAIISQMQHSSVDGMIITFTRGLKEDLERLKKDHVPFVLLDRILPEIETNAVVLDNYKGANDLTKHLLGNGYKNIGFISMFESMSQLQQRKRGYLDALKEAGYDLKKIQTLELSFHETDQQLLEKIKEFLKKNTHLDALFFASNYLGVLGIEAIQQSGFQIPADFAVVSFDDNDLFRLMTPSITVVSQPVETLAKKSIQMLLDCIENNQTNQQMESEVIAPELIIRQSTPVKK